MTHRSKAPDKAYDPNCVRLVGEFESLRLQLKPRAKLTTMRHNSSPGR